MPVGRHGATTPNDKYLKDVPNPSVTVTVYGDNYQDLMDQAQAAAERFFGLDEARDLVVNDNFNAEPFTKSTDGTVHNYKAVMTVEARTLNPSYDPLTGTSLAEGYEDDEDDDEDGSN